MSACAIRPCWPRTSPRSTCCQAVVWRSAWAPGWNKPEHDAIGIPFEPAGVRIKRLTEAIAILKGCFAEGPFSFSGEHYTITGHDGAPKSAQRPHPPIFLGGGGKRLLTLAAREAQIIGLAPRLVTGRRAPRRRPEPDGRGNRGENQVDPRGRW